MAAVKRRGGITRRWVSTTIVVIGAVLLVFAVVTSFLVHSYYYNAVRMTLDSRADSSGVAAFFSSYLGAPDSAFSARAQEFVDNFKDSSLMEVWVIDRSGNVVATSTGFGADDSEAPDYAEAVGSESGFGRWTGRLSGGEKVMAVTVMLPRSAGGSNGALRFISSLEAIDAQHLVLTVLISAFCLFSLGLVALSGAFFIRSIVRPVKNINDVAGRIAGGEYELPPLDVPQNNDEIGELCRTINRMAGELSRTEKLKNDFISTVSHELRTPLTAIKGWGETLKAMSDEDALEKDAANKGLSVIISESDRLYSLVSDLLDFSKMQNNRMVLKKSRIDALELLDETVFVFTDRAKRENVSVNYTPNPEPALVLADPDRLRQVYANVLDNAVKYSRPGGKVTVGSGVSDGYLEITISDTGQGISAEDLPHVKEKFYKGENSVRGSGIGLAVCDEIMALHGGTLDIQSVFGQGTTVMLTLPTS
ncbi:MAG: HAMP domain-containing histidine kinase [Clostridia bacterium]|nr:HAMP domain-containing histidine kinase [Clostridia bacterium]